MRSYARARRALPLLALALLVLIGAPATAQTTDVLGVFFDAEGTVDRISTGGAFAQVEAYLIVLYPSEVSGVGGWECSVDVLCETELGGFWTLAGQALNIDTPPSFMVGMAAPLPWSEALLLATHTAFVPDPSTEVEYYVHAHDPPSLEYGGQPLYHPAYAAGADPDVLVPLDWAVDCEMRPAAAINDLPLHDLAWQAPEPASLDFGTLDVGETEYRSLLLRNDAGATLVGRVRIEGEGYRVQAGGEPAATELDFRIPPSSAGLTIMVSLTAPSSGVLPGEVTILSCDEVVATVPCTGDAGVPICHVAPDTLDFGYLDPGQQLELPFTISNIGGGTLQVVLPNFVLSAWAFVPVGLVNLGPGEVLNATARFAPPDDHGYTLVEDFGTGQCELVLIGNGGAGTGSEVFCIVAPDTLDFGEVVVGVPAQQQFRLTAVGGELSGHLADGCGDFAVTGGGGDFVLSGSRYWQVVFTPTEAGERTCAIPIDGICADLVCTGIGLEVIEDCYLSPDALDFGAVVPGGSAAREARVYNTGNATLDGEVREDCAFFAITVGAGAFSIPPGGSHRIVVEYAPPEEGVHACTVELGLAACPGIPCTGTAVGPPVQQDIIGVYFDTGGANSWLQTTMPLQLVTAYLLILDPSAGYGVAGWECCVQIAGDVLTPTWELAGNAVNVDEPPCFAVGLAGEPLPWSLAVKLATVRFVQVSLTMETLIYIHPGTTPSLPGVPSYADGLDPSNLIPLQVSSGDEDLPVAFVNASPLAAAVGPLAAAVEGAGVRLSWSYDPERIEGFHVYRRLEGGPQRRLTGAPLRGWQGRAEYLDPADGLPAGTVLHYQYAPVAGDGELGRGEEIAVTLGGVAPAVTALEAPYPNPFNPSTHLRFQLAAAGRAQLEIFDLAGRRVATLVDAWLPAGVHEESWQGRDDAGRPVPSGVYYCRLVTPLRSELRKLTLLK